MQEGIIFDKFQDVMIKFLSTVRNLIDIFIEENFMSMNEKIFAKQIIYELIESQCTDWIAKFLESFLISNQENETVPKKKQEIFF